MSAIANHQLLAEYTMHLAVERSLSPNTVAAYTADLMQFAEILDQRNVLLFTADKDDVGAFIHHLAKHDIGPRSRARKITSLRRFYLWLIRSERIERDPTRLTVTPKLPKLLPRPVEPEAMRTILSISAGAAAADGAEPIALRNHAILETLYGGGLRVSELCGMVEADVAVATGTARVRGKGDRERIVPLGDSAIAALGNYLELARPHFLKIRAKGKPTRALFLSELGRGISRKRVHEIIAAAGGEEHLYPHRLRHSCATDMLVNGADLRSVQDQLGHQSIATTQIYTKISTGHLQEAHRKFHPRGRGMERKG